MGDNTKIEWTDSTWQPITGCSVVSPGCTNCYAMKMAGTRLKHHPSRIGLTDESKAGPVWNGKLRFNEQWLDQPSRWRRPRNIFVCAHGDLFHEDAPDEWLDQVFMVMAMNGQHRFQVLTKRAERMREYVSRGPAQCVGDIYMVANGQDECPWPLPNVHLGVSVEDQQRANERIPLLVDTPAAVRWISAEPLLGYVDLTHWQTYYDGWHLPLDWVVVGGESGKGSRPMHPEWARMLRDKCEATETPFLFKQWGDWHPFNDPDNPLGWLDERESRSITTLGSIAAPKYGGQRMVRVGKKRAGRELDGREWNEMPRTAA